MNWFSQNNKNTPTNNNHLFFSALNILIQYVHSNYYIWLYLIFVKIISIIYSVSAIFEKNILQICNLTKTFLQKFIAFTVLLCNSYWWNFLIYCLLSFLRSTFLTLLLLCYSMIGDNECGGSFPYTIYINIFFFVFSSLVVVIDIYG